MGSIGRFLRTVYSLRLLSTHNTLIQPPSNRNSIGALKYHIHSKTSHEIWLPSVSDGPRSFSIFPSVLTGLFGVGLVHTTHADAEEVAAKPELPSMQPSSYDIMEELARKEKLKLLELLITKGMKNGSYPMFTVAAKGQKVTVRFQIPPTCEVPHLMANLVSHLGLKVKVSDDGSSSAMMMHAWNSAAAWQLTLSNPEKLNEGEGNQGLPKLTNEHEGDLCIFIFQTLFSSQKAEIEFIKQGSFSSEELDGIASTLQIAGEKMGGNKKLENKPRGDIIGDTAEVSSAKKSISSLEALGVRIFGLDGNSSDEISWENIAGYDEQKREIEDTVLLALNSPEVYDDIARGTRCKFESSRPRAVLFEGPPGTGKTSCARVIANQSCVPLLYVPLEVVVSKYYGESERSLGKVFKLANELPNGAIIFLDEVDSFAISRHGEMHEATRRILSLLLRQIDGFEQDKKVVVIAATNRKQDLDPALLSRFNSVITFGLPNQQNREAIAAQFAKHLSKSELVEFARITEEMSGRDIRDVCLQAERHWASKIIRGQTPKDDGNQVRLPPLEEYIGSAMNRRKAMFSAVEELNSHHKQNRVEI